MGEFYGASVDELRDLARIVTRQGERLEHEIVQGLDQAITVSPWSGMDAESFTGAWRASLVPMLRHAAAALLAAGDTLNRQAAEQEQASSADVAWPDFSGLPKAPFDILPSRIRLLDGDDGQFADLFDDEGKLTQTAIDLLKTAIAGGMEPIPLGKIMAGVEDLNFGAFDAIPGVLQMFSGAASLSGSEYDPFAASSFFQGLLSAGSSVFSGASTVLGGAAGMLGAFTDGARAVEGFASGNVLAGVYDTAHGLAAGTGVFIPPVAWCLGAWDTGVTIGTTIAETPAFQSNLDEATQIGLEKVGGDPSKLVERYEGVPGFFNAQFDSIQAWFQ